MIDSLYQLVARDFMTSPAVACRDEAFFEEVADILADLDISGMPVVDDENKVIGVVSERDLAHMLGGPMVRLAVRRHNHRSSAHEITSLPRDARRVKDIMTAPALTATQDAPVKELARMMRVNQISRVPILDKDRLIGLVTRGDVLAAIAQLCATDPGRRAAPVVVAARAPTSANA